MFNRAFLVIAGLALVPLGLLAWGAVVLADTYWSDNPNLEESALELVPEGWTVVFADSDECNRSGWEGVFTFRDTCYQIRVDSRSSELSPRKDAIRVVAQSNGWQIVHESLSGLDLSRPGYIAIVRLRDSADINSCVASSEERGACYDLITVIDER